jgi:hypothetical protein
VGVRGECVLPTARRGAGQRARVWIRIARVGGVAVGALVFLCPPARASLKKKKAAGLVAGGGRGVVICVFFTVAQPSRHSRRRWINKRLRKLLTSSTAVGWGGVLFC